MTAETIENTTKLFKFSFPTCTNEDVLFKLEVPVLIPHDGSTRELVQRVLNMFHIPVYLEEELNEKLAEFVSKETKTFHDERDAALISQLKNSELNVDGIVKNWEKLFKDNVVEFAEQKGTSDEEVFAAAYHKLVHSPALETILQVENSYAKTVMNTLKNRDEDIKKLTQRQTEEMEEKVRLLNTSTTEEEINALAAAHFEAQSVVAGRWGSQLDALAQAQRAHHRRWLMATLEEYQTTSALNTPSNSPLATFSADSPLYSPAPAPTPGGPRLEESFTIHLGSQLKQTHNIRIVAADPLDLCRVDNLDNGTAASRRLQTSLALYSSELAAVVLLCDSPPPRLAPPTTLLAAAAQAATEHHFADVDAQLRLVAERVKGPVEKRNSQRFKEQAENANRGNGSGVAPPRPRSKRNLQTGDVFVTKHSNLADVHVVFHLIVDDSSLRSGARPRRRRAAARGLGRATQSLLRRRRHHLAAPRHPGPAQHPEGGVQQRRDQHLAAAAAAPRALRGDDAGVVHAPRRAGAEVREGLRAGGGGLGRRRAADAALPAAARHARRPLHGAGAPAAQHLPPLQPRQGQAALRRDSSRRGKVNRVNEPLHSTVYLSNVNRFNYIDNIRFKIPTTSSDKRTLYDSLPTPRSPA
ncbi:protein C12orf4 homolog isoform X1 [Hyposmocoma kahamanoa]|uniref:protein C12orf4 homolog isoform X1 n=1 Tax=Hyposmocoma kahamanoa TaxID=1477025 RepID=UPI000E6D5D6A|nr:protein C12orf4 homolog isoform X1 [Hyposmocoma kahamanoa]